MDRGYFNAERWKVQLPPRWSLASGNEISQPQYQILSRELSAFQAHSEVGQYETPL
jgi:hypothetical protein